MVASLSLRVYTGTNAATESSAQDGISFLSIDSAANDLTTRQLYPVITGTNSFSKHCRLKCDVAPASSVGTFKWWTDGAGYPNVNLKAKQAVGTGGTSPGSGDSTPSATALTGDIDAYTKTAASKGDWDTTIYSGGGSVVGKVTKSLVLQLQPLSNAQAGTWPTQTIYYSYDEV